VGDDDDQAIDVTRHETADPVHRTVEVFGIEAPEPLVEEEAVQASASARASDARKVSPPESESAVRSAAPAFMSRTWNASSSLKR
jgi:hypothetical protein